MINVLYFSWLRERLGISQESIDSRAGTVAELVAELMALDDDHAIVFKDTESLRVAVDKTMGDFETSIVGAHEVAFFPPMTGG